MPIRNAPYSKPAKRTRSVSSVSKIADLQPEIARQRRQGERQHEAVVESIRQRAEHERRDQQVRVPALEDGEARLDEGQRRRQHQAARNTGRSRRPKRSATSTSSFEYGAVRDEAVAERQRPSAAPGSTGWRRRRDWRRSRGRSRPRPATIDSDADVEERVELDEDARSDRA